MKEVHWVIKFNQNAWLKQYIDINTDLWKKSKKNDFEKIFFKLRNSAVFGKTMENGRKYRDLKLVTEKRRNYLVSEPKNHNTKFFAKYLWGIEIRNK